jgi:hypothetical protein
LQFLIDHAVAVDEEGKPLDLTLPETTSGDQAAAESTPDGHQVDEQPEQEHAEHEEPQA